MNKNTKSLTEQKKLLRKNISKIFKEKASYCESVKKIFGNREHCKTFLKKIPEIENFKTAFGYAELPNEFPCLNLLKTFVAGHKSKIAGLPVVTEDRLIFRQVDFSEESTDLKKSADFGILEPDKSCRLLFSGLEQSAVEEQRLIKTLEEISPILVLTPARAFSKDGSRLGRGGGFYDRFFAKLSQFQSSNQNIQFIAVGLAYHFQVLDFVPSDANDFKVKFVIVEK